MRTTYYSVQILDDKWPKRIPHTGKNNCEFLDKKKAEEFLQKLKTENPNEKFRILKRIETYQPLEWI